MKSVYLDVYCLNRPFDDQTQERIRLESEAIILIFKHIENQDWQWVSSEIVDFEIDKMPDLERKHRIHAMKIFPSHYIMANELQIERGQSLQEKGFDVYDALHLACAETSKADVMLTTDDKLKRLANRYSNELNIRVENPLIWLQELLP
jgi:predicted nucleic acid-binding protein